MSQLVIFLSIVHDLFHFADVFGLFRFLFFLFFTGTGTRTGFILFLAFAFDLIVDFIVLIDGGIDFLFFVVHE